MHGTVADFLRLGLTLVWGTAAWFLLSSRPLSALRMLGGLTAVSWSLYYFAFNASLHLGWGVDWHNAVSRILSYLLAATFIVWGKRTHDLYIERKEHGLAS